MSAQSCASQLCNYETCITGPCIKRSAIPAYSSCEICITHITDRTPAGWCAYLGGYPAACSPAIACVNLMVGGMQSRHVVVIHELVCINYI